MTLILAVASGEITAEPITLSASRVSIGSAKSCDLVLDCASVDARHATLRFWQDEWLIVDEGSREGSSVGGVALRKSVPRVVRAGDRIAIGRVHLELREEGLTHETKPTLEIALQALVRGFPCVPTVRVVEGPSIGSVLGLDAQKAYVVGRGASADLTLNDEDVSRAHVEVELRGAGVFVRDLGSKGGARLGKELLAGNEHAPWTAGSMLSVGQSVLALDSLESVISKLAGKSEEPPLPPTPVGEAVVESEGLNVEQEAPNDGAPAAAAPIALVSHATEISKSPGERKSAIVVIALLSAVMLGAVALLLWIFAWS